MNDIIKNLTFDKIKPMAIAAICFAAVFIAGFGSGKVHSGIVSSGEPVKRSLSNSTTETEGAAKTESATKTVETNKKSAPANASSECYIKGSKSKIYHVPGGSFYERTNAAQCFASEEEAQAAGFTKSSR